MAYRVLGLLCLMAAIAYIQRAALSVPATTIATDLEFADLARDMGYVQSAWYLGYALLQVPGGWLVDRLGWRTALLRAGCAWSVFTILASCVQGRGTLIVIWALMGAAQAAAFPSAAKAIGQLFADSARARAAGLLAAGMALGGAIAPGLTSLALSTLQVLLRDSDSERWRWLLALYGLIGLAWAAVFAWSVPPAVTDSALQPSTESAQPLTWQRVIRNGSLWLLCAQQFFRAAAMVFFLTWFPTFLQKTRGVSLQESGLLATLAGTGGVLGSILGGVCSDALLRWTKRRRLSRQGIAVLGMSCCAGLILLSANISNTWLSVLVIALGAFCATFGGVSGYTVAIDLGGRHVGTAFSTMNMCGNLGASLFPIAAGFLVARTGNWNQILFLFAGMMVIDAVCWALLNPRHTLAGEPL